MYILAHDLRVLSVRSEEEAGEFVRAALRSTNTRMSHRRKSRGREDIYDEEEGEGAAGKRRHAA